MNRLQVHTVLALLGAAACGCSGASDQAFCPGVADPTVLTLADVTPAAGAIVTNEAIVHSFSVLNDIAFDDIAFRQLPSHTAGDAIPSIAFTYTIAAESTDFTAAPVVWSHAPGHVEIDAPLVYQTTDGCAYTLPSPLFSYDLSGPVSRQ